MKTIAKLAIAAGCICGGLTMLAGANYVAGKALFMIYRQPHSDASFWTIRDAWASGPDKPTKKKIMLSMLIGGGLCIAVPIGLLMGAMSTRRPLHGAARFAHQGDIKNAGLRAARGILLGKQGGQLLRLPGFEHVMLAAPTRTKKGAAHVVPNLLTFEDSVVAQDIKEELYVLTGEVRRRMGQEVFYWNPFSETSHRSNPLTYVSTDPNMRVSDLQAMAANIYAEQPNEPPIWIGSARDLFLGVTLMVLETPELPPTLGEVLRQASGKGMPLQDYLAMVIREREASATPLSRMCVDALRRFLGASENTLKGILSTFLAPLSLWSNPLVDKATSGDDFDVRELRKKRMSVYVCAPVRQIQGAGLLMNLFFSQVIGENLREQPQDNPALKHQVLLMLDEFTAMGKVDIIAKAVAYMASYNLRLDIVIQDSGQLVDVYGKEAAHNIMSNMGAKIWFAPAEIKDAEHLSATIGYITERVASKQYSNNASASGGSTGRSLTYTEQRRALMLPQELRELSPTKQLVIRTGLPVIMADKTVYYEDPQLRQRFESVPGSMRVVDGSPRRIPHAVPRPGASWATYHADLARSDHYLRRDHDESGDNAGGMDESQLLSVINRLAGAEPGAEPADDANDLAMEELVALKARDFLAQLEQQQANAQEAVPSEIA